jgi:hypothetical protein
MFSNLDLQQILFGRLTWESIPYHEPILIIPGPVGSDGCRKSSGLIGLLPAVKVSLEITPTEVAASEEGRV